MKVIMKVLPLIVSLVMCLSLTIDASGNDVDSKERRNAAKKYLQVVPMDKMLDASISEISKNIEPEKREDFIMYMKGMLRAEVLEEISINSMVKTFTVEEINAMTDFYGSDLGKSIMNKFGIYMGDVMPAIQQEMTRAFMQLQEEGKL